VSLLRDVLLGFRAARLLVANRPRCVELAGSVSPEVRDSSLLVLTEDDTGVDICLVDLAGYLNRATRAMAPDMREAFIDAAGVATGPGEMRALVLTEDARIGRARFYTVEVAP
jgi:hypothetical protein